VAQDRIPTGTIFSALSGYWIRKHRVPLVTIILVLGLGFSALLFLPAGGEGENEDNVLKKYLSGRKKPSSKAANYKAPEETEGGDLATWLKKKLPEKIRAELASFKVKEDEKPPEGMDPDLWEMERMTVLKKGTTALHRKNYQEADPDVTRLREVHDGDLPAEGCQWVRHGRELLRCRDRVEGKRDC